jgi:hypothetical protein
LTASLALFTCSLPVSSAFRCGIQSCASEHMVPVHVSSLITDCAVITGKHPFVISMFRKEAVSRN